jgi:dipeptidyl aminopeptidase/acylaminoacyl peptidase
MPVLPTHWSRDGQYLLQSAFSPDTGWDVWVLPLNGGEPFAYAATTAEEKNAQMSPNGRWLAYTTNQSGVEEVHVQSFPTPGATRWQVSAGGARQPQWRPDGKQLFYMSLDKKLMAVDVESSGSTFVHRAPRVIVEARAGGGIERTYQGNLYAVSGDGERVLLTIGDGALIPITIVLNWQSVLAQDR